MTVSVVMIASAAEVESQHSDATSTGMPALIGASSRG